MLNKFQNGRHGRPVAADLVPQTDQLCVTRSPRRSTPHGGLLDSGIDLAASARMDVLHEPPPRSDADRRVIAGWAALEQGDIEEARAALSDVYAVAPTHPALPLLAAGIRRIRPRRFPWRGVVLLLIVIGGGALAVYSRARTRAAQVDNPPVVASAERPRSEAPAAAPSSTTATPASAPSASVTGTSGSHEPALTPPVPEPSRPTGTEDAQIRQAIARFATAYSSRWTPLTFSSCDIARGEESAIVTCQSRGASSPGDGANRVTWTFSCRKVDETWKIVSMQPPAESQP